MLRLASQHKSNGTLVMAFELLEEQLHGKRDQNIYMVQTLINVIDKGGEITGQGKGSLTLFLRLCLAGQVKSEKVGRKHLFEHDALLGNDDTKDSISTVAYSYVWKN